MITFIVVVFLCCTSTFIIKKFFKCQRNIDNSCGVVEAYDLNNSNINNETQTIGFNDEIIKEWKIIIPQINLEAPIAEGTDTEILNKYIGHFEETPRKNGNIALAAHNRGYEVNYFSRLKELKPNNNIYYIYNDYKQCYKIISKKIIQDTYIEVLDNTNEDTITLITCVENRPSLRLCIVGKVIK